MLLYAKDARPIFDHLVLPDAEVQAVCFGALGWHVLPEEGDEEAKPQKNEWYSSKHDEQIVHRVDALNDSGLGDG